MKLLAFAISATIGVLALSTADAEQAPSWTRYNTDSSCWTTQNTTLATSPSCTIITNPRLVTTPVPCIRDGEPDSLPLDVVYLHWEQASYAADGTYWVPAHYGGGWSNWLCWLPIDLVRALDNP